MEGAPYPPVPLLTAALGSKCPRCGRGGLYQGLLQIRARCPVCELDLSQHDTGDGAAVFVIMILGAVVVGLALWVELTFAPPLWLHAVLWTPLTLAGAVLMLRVIKAGLIAQQYRLRQLNPGSEQG